MTCWDNSQVTNWSSCPTSPQNQADCLKLGKNWCTYTSSYSTAVSGWCSAMTCTPSAPAGKMVCPDGKSFGASITDCPKNGTATPTPVPTPTQVRCSDGTYATTAANCPVAKKIDEVTGCLTVGGTWCTAASATTKGYCAPKGTTCSATIPPTVTPIITETNRPLPPLPPERIEQTQTTPISPTIIKQIDREKKSLLRELISMERLFKKNADAAALAKLTALRTKIEQLQGSDSGVFDTLDAVREEMDNLRAAYQDLVQNGKANEPERDAAYQKRALTQMKKGVKTFKRYIILLNNKIKSVEKSGVVVPEDIKAMVTTASDLVAQAEDAQTYDEIKSVMEQMPDAAQNLNDVIPEIDQLARLPKVLKIVKSQVSSTARLVKSTTTATKRYKVDVSDQVDKMNSLMDEIKAAVENLKTGAFEGDDVLGYIQDNVLDKIDSVRTLAGNITAITNIKRYTNSASAAARRYTTAIKKMDRLGEDTSEATTLLADMQDRISELQALAKQKLTEETGNTILDHMENINSTRDQLDEILNLAKPGALEEQIRRSLTGGKAEVAPVEVDELEKLLVSAYRTANFFRTSPYRTLALLN